jgi:hypothetical protein
MRMLIVMIGAWLMLSAFLVVAVINDNQSWVSYLLGASVVIGLAISGTILTLP